MSTSLRNRFEQTRDAIVSGRRQIIFAVQRW